MTVYKIKNRKTGLFSSGGYYPSFSKHGKSWTAKGYIKSHLTYVGKGYYEDCDIVEYELQEVSVEPILAIDPDN